MTRNEARAYFRDKGLTYADVKLEDLHILRDLLDKHIIQDRTERVQAGKYLYWVRVNKAKYYKGSFDPITGAMFCAFITGNGTYFHAREVISFNLDGFIGFCGDTDNKNAVPILAAFVEWCDWLAARKEK